VHFLFNKKYKFSLNSIGSFNIYNALVGIGCGLIFGVSINKIKEALDSFRFLEGRLNKIDNNKFSILDDSYNSNPLSLRNAIESLAELKTQGRRILVMGDMLELGSRSVELHQQIGRFIVQKPINMLVTLGKLSKYTADIAKFESKKHLNTFTFDSKIDLIDFLRNKIKFGDILLIKGSRRMKMEEIAFSLAKAI
jgi:UDP-N-acetylmuramoyl-tripeptide--D-alanyl-D-alanine ligase